MTKARSCKEGSLKVSCEGATARTLQLRRDRSNSSPSSTTCLSGVARSCEGLMNPRRSFHRTNTHREGIKRHPNPINGRAVSIRNAYKHSRMISSMPRQPNLWSQSYSSLEKGDPHSLKRNSQGLADINSGLLEGRKESIP